MMNKFHPFHMITLSPWPILGSLMALMMASHTSMMMANKTKSLMIQSSSVITALIASSWWSDTHKEASKEGMHQQKVITGLKMGMLLFICSEIMFFSSFFWAYFHESVSPNTEIGQMWPPNAIKSFNPINVPLLNTLILVSSGVSVTWSHHALLKGESAEALKGLMVTCSLGLYFSALQYMEYKQAEFNMNDSSYGSVFFLATGFHGIHVIIGSTFLITTMMMMKKFYLSTKHHTSFEMAAWYWHFVDVVWLFLYLSIYWWGK